MSTPPATVATLRKSARRHSCGSLPERIWRSILHWIVIKTGRLLFLLICRVHVVEIAPVPRQGALIMASNHISHFDPSIISGFFPRRIDWLAMEEIFCSFWSKHFFTWLNCIPVNRNGSDRTALRNALHRLADHRVIGIFPEGGLRTGEWSILNGAPMKPGLAALSMHSGIPVIPCVLIGSDHLYKPANWLHRTSIYLLIGDAVEPPKEDALQTGAKERFASELAKAFTSMKEEAVMRFGISLVDLPQSPQQRKGEHP